jgi:hypothetical protein
MVIARIIGVSLLVALAGYLLAYSLAGQHPDWQGLGLILGCVGGIIGGIAGAAREIVAASRQRP